MQTEPRVPNSFSMRCPMVISPIHQPSTAGTNRKQARLMVSRIFADEPDSDLGTESTPYVPANKPRNRVFCHSKSSLLGQKWSIHNFNAARGPSSHSRPPQRG